MSLDLVARARSMDGSADLKWRNADHSLAYHIGGPRSGAEGRSLDWSTSKGRGKKRQRFVLSYTIRTTRRVSSRKFFQMTLYQF